MRFCVLLFWLMPLFGETRTVRVEEPTGLYRRVNEVVAVPFAKLGGHRTGFRVVDAAGTELPWQVSGGDLLFPASVMPGELPVYTVTCCSPAGARFENTIVLRRIGINRVELGNARFRILIDAQAGAIVEAYNLSAGPQRVLNLVEITPEDPKALKDDIHGQEGGAPTAIEGENTGWTSLGASGAFTKIEFLETGPLRGRLRLSRSGDDWEFTWTGASAALGWRASRGFRFAAVSALPFLPFDRFVGGSEYDWPSGPESAALHPPASGVRARDWKKLPGGHAVYYTGAENYGALGIVALDSELEWRGIGSRRFAAEKPSGRAEIALTFPDWKGAGTVLEAWKENRILRNPLLATVARAAEAGETAVRRAAAREPVYTVERNAPPAARFDPRVLVLDGEWELAWGEKGAAPSSEWRRVRVPGSVHLQWLPAPKYYTREAEWISYKEWWYRKRFKLPDGFTGARARLQFGATDYYADAWLNGSYLGRHEGYIDPYEYDVQLRAEGENELLVRVWTPVTYYWRHRPYSVKGSYGAVDQKPDDITALGITRGVRLVASEGLRIRDAAVATRLVEGGAAEVEVALEAVGVAANAARWELTLSPRNFSSSERWRIRAPARRVDRFVFRLDRPELWWTWDHGKPNLYTLDLRLLSAAGKPLDGRTLAVGIREIEKLGWIFYLNRKRLFIRGTNSYYNLFLSEMDRGAYERDFKLMLGMNVNMIRLHCHFTNPEFYDLADERGVLIWQDYLEAWYPHDTAFSRRAAALYDPLIRHARNHPSVALWATSDEEDLENYRDLTKHLAARLFLLDPERRAVVRSTGRYGDAHVYHGWYGGSIWEYTRMGEAFVSELGATALPNYESLVKFLPDAWPIRDHADRWIFHKLQIPEAMRAWGEPGSLTLQEYIPRTQAYVARLFQVAIERMRRLKYQPAGGILHFHAIDIWPSVTMAAVDFYRVPTQAYETVRRSFAPVLASLEYDRDRWAPGETFRCGVWLVNDEWRGAARVEVAWRIVDASGREHAKGQYETPMVPDSARKLGEAVFQFSTPGHYRLIAEVREPGGGLLSANVFEFEVGA